MASDEGRTYWFVPGEKCPRCQGPIATDGMIGWCANEACGWKDGVRKDAEK